MPQLRAQSGATCLDQSIDDYTAVRVDDASVFYVRGHQVLRRPR